MKEECVNINDDFDKTVINRPNPRPPPFNVAQVPVEEEAPQPSSRRGSRRGKKTSTPVIETTVSGGVAAMEEEIEDGGVTYVVRTSATDKMTESRTEAIAAENGR